LKVKGKGKRREKREQVRVGSRFFRFDSRARFFTARLLRFLFELDDRARRLLCVLVESYGIMRFSIKSIR